MNLCLDVLVFVEAHTRSNWARVAFSCLTDVYPLSLALTSLSWLLEALVLEQVLIYPAGLAQP